jgi:hypothetical protein
MLIRLLALVAAALMVTAGAVLGYIAVIAARRSEGVFLPTGYVAVACLVGGGLLLRFGLRA